MLDERLFESMNRIGHGQGNLPCSCETHPLRPAIQKTNAQISLK